jgi:hypothetical protein
VCNHPVFCPRLRRDEESLSIPNVNEGDQGVYTCTAQSEIDQDVSSARLTVLGALGLNTLLRYTALHQHTLRDVVEDRLREWTAPLIHLPFPYVYP